MKSEEQMEAMEAKKASQGANLEQSITRYDILISSAFAIIFISIAAFLMYFGLSIFTKELIFFFPIGFLAIIGALLILTFTANTFIKFLDE